MKSKKYVARDGFSDDTIYVELFSNNTANIVSKSGEIFNVVKDKDFIDNAKIFIEEGSWIPRRDISIDKHLKCEVFKLKYDQYLYSIHIKKIEIISDYYTTKYNCTKGLKRFIKANLKNVRDVDNIEIKYSSLVK